MRLTFIINGEDTLVEADQDAPIEGARDWALVASRNTGRPPETWDVRSRRGEMLNPAAAPAALGLVDGDRLFLVLQVGAGG